MNEIQFLWGHSGRYNDFPRYFRRLFNERVQKLSVDGGFTCPNRDGTKGRGGCTYCNNETFNPEYCRLEETIFNQVQEGIDFFSKKYKSMKFLAYFQAYSNTYAPLSVLKERYEEALLHPSIVGIVVATRPDCVDERILDYLAELSERYYVMVEYGIETINDDTLKRINRGHKFADSVRAIEMTSSRGLSTCVHLILGLPGEGRDNFLEQARVISELPVENLKLHQLQIHKGTVMASEYDRNPEHFKLFSFEEYLELSVDFLELLNPSIIVERFVSQAPSDMVVAPKWGLKNYEFASKLEKLLETRQTWQGRLWKS